MISIESLLNFQGYPLEKAQQEMLRIQSFSKDEYYAWQENKKWELVRFHHQHNPFYRKFVGATLPDRWEDIPILRKNDLQVNSSNLISNGLKSKDLHFGSTSGSSGIPLKFARDKFSHSMTWALILDRYSRVGLKSTDYQARFYGIPLARSAYYKERIKDYFMNRYRFVIFDISENSLQKFIDKFRASPFRYLYGYTNSQIRFAHYLQSKGLKLTEICPTVTCAIVTSEQCNPEDKAFLESVFQVPVYVEYGAAEVAFLAMSDPQGVSRLSNETVITEVISDDELLVSNGKPGRLIFTNLFNTAMQFIRYEVGDLGVIEEDPHQVQDKLLDLKGRLNEQVILPSGKIAAGFTIYYISKHLMGTFGHVSEYQVQQLSSSKFIFSIVTDREIDKSVTTLIQEAFDKYLEPGLEVAIQKVNAIDREKSGKLKHFISHINSGAAK
ncbi:MAG: phenylacetate--CoA ligase family protein [Algoriphagus sp.]